MAVIAAYNTGAGNVAKTITGNNRNMRDAIEIINKLSSDEFYAKLIKDLPFAETREYLKNVIQRRDYYKSVYPELQSNIQAAGGKN